MKNSAIGLFKDLGIIALLLLFPHLIPLPFYSYAALGFFVMWLLLRRKGRSLSDTGLTKQGLTAKTILIASASAIAWVAFMQLAYIPAIKRLFAVADYTEYNFIIDNTPALFTTLIAAWLIGGLYEELLFRGYILNLLEKRLSGYTFLSITVTGLLFGLYHWQQGIFGIIAAALGGISWGILYRKSGNNLWIPILSHALFDTLTLLLIYTGRFGNL